MNLHPRTLLAAALAAAFTAGLQGQTLSSATQAKIDGQIREIATWAADPAIVEAVRAHNASVPTEQARLDQDKWRLLTVIDPIVRGFTKNPAGQALKARKTDLITEAFVSDAAGFKVAFLSKTTNWSHAGKPKHDVPMAGKTWQGPVEVDESSGQQQVQVAVPVLDGGKPIGSLVVGLSVTKLSP
ncbi:MAG: hypothetical protein NTV51_05725 [Verrucomicrobia bacterium]|nr:hypothetical protein [Verrucomicrobiota bacterium]